MRQLVDIENELERIGARIKFIGRRGIRELPHILVDNEQIKYCISGRYSGGYAILCVTDLRILLIDKKPFFLTLEDIRYDMVMEVDYNYQAFSATMKIFMPNKTLTFMAYKKHELRMMTRYIQKRVFEHRQQHVLEQQLNLTDQPEQRAFTNPRFKTDPVSLAAGEAAPSNGDIPISIPRAINPYIKSTLTVRRRSSRF